MTELEQLDAIENEVQRMLGRLVDLRKAIKSGRLGMTTQELAEQAAEVLRQRGYRVVDNSVSWEDLSDRITCGQWVVQPPDERPRFMTDLQVIELAGEGE